MGVLIERAASIREREQTLCKAKLQRNQNNKQKNLAFKSFFQIKNPIFSRELSLRQHKRTRTNYSASFTKLSKYVMLKSLTLTHTSMHGPTPRYTSRCEYSYQYYHQHHHHHADCANVCVPLYQKEIISISVRPSNGISSKWATNCNSLLDVKYFGQFCIRRFYNHFIA